MVQGFLRVKCIPLCDDQLVIAVEENVVLQFNTFFRYQPFPVEY